MWIALAILAAVANAAITRRPFGVSLGLTDAPVGFWGRAWQDSWSATPNDTWSFGALGVGDHVRTATMPDSPVVGDYRGMPWMSVNFFGNALTVSGKVSVDGTQVWYGLANNGPPKSWIRAPDIAADSNYYIFFMNGTVTVNDVTFQTALQTEAPSFAEAALQVETCIQKGTSITNPFFRTNGSLTTSTTIGNGQYTNDYPTLNGNENSNITFSTPPGTSYIMLNATMGPNLAKVYITFDPPADMDGGQRFLTGEVTPQWTTPGILFAAPMDPTVNYTVNLHTQPAQGTSGWGGPRVNSFHSATFWTSQGVNTTTTNGDTVTTSNTPTSPTGANSNSNGNANNGDTNANTNGNNNGSSTNGNDTNTSSDAQMSTSSSVGAIAGGVVGGVVALAAIGVLVAYLMRRGKGKSNNQPREVKGNEFHVDDDYYDPRHKVEPFAMAEAGQSADPYGQRQGTPTNEPLLARAEKEARLLTASSPSTPWDDSYQYLPGPSSDTGASTSRSVGPFAAMTTSSKRPPRAEPRPDVVEAQDAGRVTEVPPRYNPEWADDGLRENREYTAPSRFAKS